ncbi:type II toxin-antitoxin system HigB family toxin [Phormidesmis priestleyi ULC007]|uniref:Type II toxin-antitoxin system HigB family toxin n=1 Tax=Phormidesmis priestleyi ULC007 TaxID=1920490 RepID=A0A2T1DHV2_9CYAN|nr:type II toxin-antitoxin system HigB family toxin [Phormidesmis priestleyi ULC007]PZO48953.1 MAG: type II toxin-antitoxin system HigB family toxin [Phormidesmis priestleyi]
MHVISRRKLRDFCENHADACEALDDWFKTTNQAEWKKLVEVQCVYPQAEAVGNLTVFNIRGNRYRLIASINYERQIVYVKYVLTHAEYDKDTWKNDLYY